MFLLLLALTASGCAARDRTLVVSDLPSRDMSGHLMVTDSGYWLERCGDAAGVRWWVTFVDGAVAEVDKAKTSGALVPQERSFVRVRAAETDERLVGPGGPALLVRAILEITPAGGCPAPTAAGVPRLIATR